MNENSMLKIVRQHYPQALSTNKTFARALEVVRERYKLEPHEIMLADSICSDDANMMQYPKSARAMLGPFKLGGLDGFPFVGQTGMGAFAHHVPEGGALFIYYAPHIGITKTGVAGQMLREGQSKASGCCGAAQAALAKITSDSPQLGLCDELDYQQNAIEHILLRQRQRIIDVDAPERIKEATAVMYEAIDERIHLLIKPGFKLAKSPLNLKHVFLLGATWINGDHDTTSFSACHRFDAIDPKTQKATSLLSHLQD